jgi:hypothetical protein
MHSTVAISSSGSSLTSSKDISILKNVIRKIEHNWKNKEWGKIKDEISPGHISYFRDCPQKCRTNGYLNLRLLTVTMKFSSLHFHSHSV